jgi:peptidoglycan/xylan/chitin deacetylase (PgdA/CDA1 family)
METNLGRWLLLGLVVLITVGLVVLVPALMRLFEPESPGEVIVPTIPVPTPTPAPTPPPTPAPTPLPTETPRPAPTPLPVLIGYAVHTAGAGDTLEEVAARYGSLAPAIASLNRFPADAPLSEGQPLVVPLFAGQAVSGTIEVNGLEVERGLPGPRVALTFDAGADAGPANAILDTLAHYGVHVTFFLTGEWAEGNPELVRRMAAGGHEIGNHTYSHPYLTELDEQAASEEILRTEQIIRELAGQTTRPLFRLPYGNGNGEILDLLARHGYISIRWSVDSLDSVGEPKSADYLVQRVTHPGVPLEGAIILMHVGNRTTADALPSILEWFRQQGYQVVTVSEILRRE